jgi:TatA/E family protein of Tat protein translocase
MGIESPVHLIFIGVVALLVLGPKRLPEVARALGHGLREFREAMNLDGDHPIEHPPVVSHPVVDPAMPVQTPAQESPALETAVQQSPAQATAVQETAVQETPMQAPGQGDPLADSFSHVQAPAPGVDPPGPVPSPDAPDSRAL